MKFYISTTEIKRLTISCATAAHSTETFTLAPRPVLRRRGYGRSVVAVVAFSVVGVFISCFTLPDTKSSVSFAGSEEFRAPSTVKVITFTNWIHTVLEKQRRRVCILETTSFLSWFSSRSTATLLSLQGGRSGCFSCILELWDCRSTGISVGARLHNCDINCSSTLDWI